MCDYAGFCAKCNGTNLDYGAMELQDSCVFYPYNCLDCKHEGKEWYNLEYTDSE